jgi:hypothetical protein
MQTYTITIKVTVTASTDDIAHETATRLCDTIGYGKQGEVVEVYADRVQRDADDQ